MIWRARAGGGPTLLALALALLPAAAAVAAGNAAAAPMVWPLPRTMGAAGHAAAGPGTMLLDGRTASLVAALAVAKLLLIPGYHSTDFEVHRNWLAITHSQPLSNWYFEDTSEWTLDYPPFFAAMEWLLSWPAMLFDPEMLVVTNLNHATPATVLYQRLSVITLDCALAAAAARLCARLYPQDTRRQALAVAFTLCNPGLLLVDHVHFQYNGALYALLLCCLAEFLAPPPLDNPLLGGALFAALLNSKHIFLYFVPPVFVFLLRGYCCTASAAGVPAGFSAVRFVTLGSAVLAVCALSFGPYVALGGLEQLPQIISRLFPFKRGLCHAYWAPNTWALYNLADKAGTVLHSRLPAALSTLVPLAPASGGPSFTGGLVHDSDAHRFLPSISPGRTLVLLALALLPSLYKLWRRPSQRYAARKRCHFLSFQNVCPEPLLVNLSFVLISNVCVGSGGAQVFCGLYDLLELLLLYALLARAREGETTKPDRPPCRFRLIYQDRLQTNTTEQSND